jgi:UDP-sulfoquinovose synthase
MKILVLGGDGFCGWPTALHLKKAGHDVTVLDNLSRRVGTTYSPSLTKIASPQDRSLASGIEFLVQDLVDTYFKTSLIGDLKPDAIIHFAEQRSAPWSMLGELEGRHTVHNNVMGTMAVLDAIRIYSPQTHLIHLGTMGVYGYNTTDDPIPEGYVDATIGGTCCTNRDGDLVTLGGTRLNVVYPPDPGSIYHMTKVLDHQLFQFYTKNWNLRITDLHQGIVWGTQTKDTQGHPDLVNRFDYDGEFGTVLNRFLVQAVTGIPLTVYGTGGQTRAFIHIQDTVRCVKAALDSGDFELTRRPRVFNQVTETHNVKALAEMISQLTGCYINYQPNPRREKVDNDLNVQSTLADIGGFSPIKLMDNLGLLSEIQSVVRANIHHFIPGVVDSKASWHK